MNLWYLHFREDILIGQNHNAKTSLPWKKIKRNELFFTKWYRNSKKLKFMKQYRVINKQKSMKYTYLFSRANYDAFIPTAKIKTFLKYPWQSCMVTFSRFDNTKRLFVLQYFQKFSECCLFNYDYTLNAKILLQGSRGNPPMILFFICISTFQIISRAVLQFQLLL